MTSLNIGLLGGTFNPPHRAHVALAKAALEQLKLDRVDLMPAGMPWQKAATAIAPAYHRLAMCHAAVEGIAGLGVEPCETQLSGNTYTVHTLKHLRSQHQNTRYTLILGADQAQRLDTWHDWQTLPQLCRFALVARAGQAPVISAAVKAALGDYDLLHMPSMAVSSSAIRTKIATQQNIAYDVPIAVERYIAKHSLYGSL